jgi:hypothetical protein
MLLLPGGQPIAGVRTTFINRKNRHLSSEKITHIQKTIDQQIQRLRLFHLETEQLAIGAM